MDTKDWGVKWIIYFIAKNNSSYMNKSLLVLIVVAVVGIGSAFAVTPYFMDSTVDEALPIGAVS